MESPILALIFLAGSSLVTGITSSIRRIGKVQAESLAKHQRGVGKLLFKKKNRDLLSYALVLTKNILLVCFTITALAFAFPLFSEVESAKTFIFAVLIILGCSVVSDYLFRSMGLLYPRSFFKTTCQLTSLFLLPFWPLALLLFKLLHLMLPPSKEASSFHIRDKILEILHDSEVAPHLDPNDQKLILSVISFKERIAREIMVPRIDMYTLSADTPVKEAVTNLLHEGYSRVPVWKESVDNIIGALYYKDLLNLYVHASEDPKKLDAPIETLLKPIVYAPETKKISQLLQVFRNKQIHLAIVVDEYGGTEGIVTIEDILEELVGEIADEYDFDEESLYTVLSSGGWIVDAKMTILDIETELGFSIPQSPEYETIGGYIFHKAGAIPSKGWRLHQDDFDLEVLSSSERTVEKIRISPH